MTLDTRGPKDGGERLVDNEPPLALFDRRRASNAPIWDRWRGYNGAIALLMRDMMNAGAA